MVAVIMRVAEQCLHKSLNFIKMPFGQWCFLAFIGSGHHNIIKL